MRIGVLLATALVLSTDCLGGGNETARLSVIRIDDLSQSEGAVSYQSLASDQQFASRQALGGELVTLRGGTGRNESCDPGYVKHDGKICQTTTTISWGRPSGRFSKRAIESTYTNPSLDTEFTIGLLY